MKAIQTRYKGPTEARGARYEAWDSDGNRVSVPIDHALNSEGNHDAAALALAAKMRWRGTLVRGGLKFGNVYVWDTPAEQLRLPGPAAVPAIGQTTVVERWEGERWVEHTLAWNGTSFASREVAR